MSNAFIRLKQWLRGSPVAETLSRPPAAFDAGFESLETRVMPAVTAFFSAGTGALTILGDNLDNSIVVSRNAAGSLFVFSGPERGVLINFPDRSYLERLLASEAA